MRGRWMSLSPRKKDISLETIHRLHVDANDEGSVSTSCCSGTDLECPKFSTTCCNCLPRNKESNEKSSDGVVSTANAHSEHDDEAGDAVNANYISTGHSIGSGWFSPDSGLVVLYKRQSTTNRSKSESREIVEVQDDLQQTVPKNPCLMKAYGYFGKKNSISAEKLLDRLRSGYKDGITDNVLGKLLEAHDNYIYYGNINQIEFLELGGVFYSFTCRTCMTPYESKMVETIANMTCFEDETKDNFVPTFNIKDSKDINKYTYILQKASYILPGVQLDDITPEVLSRKEYHECCQPVNGTKIWDHTDENTFRFTRPIIPHIYSMTIQFRVSRVIREDLDALSSLFGVCVDHAILMERTKRSVPPKIDGTAKAKSILCYTAIAGGVLVTHATVILNTAIPTVVARVIDTFGRSGLAETCETAERTRQYFLRRCREKNYDKK